MSIRALIFFGLIVASLGYTLPQQEEEEENGSSYYVNPGWIDLEQNGEYFDLLPLAPEPEVDEVLVRKARSPQGRLDGRFTHSESQGGRAQLDYVHPINKNWELYAQAERNFRYRDTNAQGGLRFKF